MVTHLTRTTFYFHSAWLKKAGDINKPPPASDNAINELMEVVSELHAILSRVIDSDQQPATKRQVVTRQQGIQL